MQYNGKLCILIWLGSTKKFFAYHLVIPGMGDYNSTQALEKRADFFLNIIFK